MNHVPQRQFPTWDELCHKTTTNVALNEELAKLSVVKPASWKKALLRFFLALTLKDDAYVRLQGFSWRQFVQVSIEHLVRNFQLQSVDKTIQEPRFGNVDGNARAFSQLPCTRDTALRRVEKALELIEKDAPILLVGDDDLVTVELAEAGFSNITVIDIDPHVLHAIEHETKDLGAKVRCFVHDLTAPKPETMAQIQDRDYGMVFLDPMYSFEGIDMFLSAALDLISHKPDTWIFLSASLLFLNPEEHEKLAQLFDAKLLEICAFQQGFNAYPIPVAYQKWIRFALRFLLSSERVQVFSQYPLQFFTSDLLLLRTTSDVAK